MSTAPPGPSVPAPGPTAPPQVTEAARRLGLGAPRAARQEASPRRTVGVGCGGALACLALLIGVGTLGSHLSVFSWAYSIAHAAAVALFVAGLSLAVFGFRGLAVGSRANFLYAGGVVHLHRANVTAVAWPDAVRMRPVRGKRRGADGAIVAYVLDGRDGAAIPVAVSAVNGRDPFLDQIIDAVRGNGGVVE